MALHPVPTAQSVQQLADAFGLGPVADAAPVPGGPDVLLRLHTAEGRFLVRRAASRTAEDVAFEVALLEHLAGAHLAVPAPRRTRDGQALWHSPAGLVTVLPWLPGEVRPRSDVEPAGLARLGRELGRVHVAAQSFPARRERTPRLEQLERELEGAAAHGDSPSTREAAREARALLARARDTLDGLEPAGVGHGDLRPSQVRWVGAEPSALYGFEEACHEPYAAELGAVLDAWCFDPVGGSWVAQSVRALLGGYEEARPLQDVERHNLWGHAGCAAVRALTARLGLPGASGALARVRSLARLGPAAFEARTHPGA